MFRYLWISRDDRQALAEQLKADAQDGGPEFSEPLYARIRQAVRDHKKSSRHTPCAVADGTRSVPATFAWQWVYAVAAAVCVGGLVLFSAWYGRGPAPRPPDRAPLAMRPAEPPVDLAVVAQTIDRTAQDLGARVESTLAMHPWGRLDQDARLTANLVLSQLQFDLTVPKEQVSQEK